MNSINLGKLFKIIVIEKKTYFIIILAIILGSINSYLMKDIYVNSIQVTESQYDNEETIDLFNKISGIGSVLNSGGGKLFFIEEMIRSKNYFLNFLKEYEYIKKYENNDLEERREYENEIYKKYMKRIDINIDSINNIMTITYRDKGRKKVNKFLIDIVKYTNNYYRKKDKELNEKSIEYLQNKITENKKVDMHQILISMIESKMKKLMINNLNEDYILQPIDKPIYSSFDLKKKIISFLTIFIGVILSYIFFVFIKRFSDIYENSNVR
ncbi:MAG: hypothetical protein VX185_09665 [Pseudomonadota bacterium]|nr:hypothetical protein [Pseudomonadota bacterium]